MAFEMRFAKVVVEERVVLQLRSKSFSGSKFQRPLQNRERLLFPRILDPRSRWCASGSFRSSGEGRTPPVRSRVGRAAHMPWMTTGRKGRRAICAGSRETRGRHSRTSGASRERDRARRKRWTRRTGCRFFGKVRDALAYCGVNDGLPTETMGMGCRFRLKSNW